MIAICKRPTKKLVKGARYEVDSLWNDGSNQRWLEGRLYIKGIGRFVVGNFTDINGNELPKINKVNPVQPMPHSARLKFEDLKSGDILICTSGNYKSLVQGGMYQIEKLVDKSTPVQSYNGSTWTRTDQSIKFVGVKRALKFSSWSFRALSSEESRDISLNQLLHDQEAPVIKQKPAKKIDLIPGKERLLVDILFKAVVDTNRHAITIPEWACQKTAPKLELETADFDHLMEMPLKEVLKLMEK